MQVKQSPLLSACNDVLYRLFVCKMKKLKIMGVIHAVLCASGTVIAQQIEWCYMSGFSSLFQSNNLLVSG